MASSNTSVASSNPSASQYPFPSHVNAASFVSIKLINRTNYGLWLEQIKCLVECHGMLGFINGELICPDEDSEEWKRYDTLVKGWIFGSLSEGAMGTVVGLQTANDVWEKLKTSYGTPAPSLTSTTITGKDTAEYLPLCEAIMTNNWEKAKEIFNQDQGAVTATISVLGKTALHLAIDRVENIQFLENLLKEIEPDILPTLVSKYGKENPLHQAAYCDNKIAAEMLVKKNPHLLFLLDERYRLPIQIAVMNSHRTTFLYLLEACENHIDLSREDGYHSPFQGTRGAFLLDYAIARGYLDVSYELIMKYPHMARTRTDRNHMYPLRTIATEWYTYYSGTRYSYFQNFVYSCLPIDINFSCDKHKIQDIENQQTRNAKLTTKCTKSCVYSGT
ncbi:hypothetical protein LXL04_033405 [Taraxacum kok-saghyz]